MQDWLHPSSWEEGIDGVHTFVNPMSLIEGMISLNFTRFVLLQPLRYPTNWSVAWSQEYKWRHNNRIGITTSKAKLTDPPMHHAACYDADRPSPGRPSKPSLVRSVVMDIQVYHLLLLLVITGVRRVFGRLCDFKSLPICALFSMYTVNTWNLQSASPSLVITASAGYCWLRGVLHAENRNGHRFPVTPRPPRPRESADLPTSFHEHIHGAFGLL